MSMDQEARRGGEERPTPEWVNRINKDQIGSPPPVPPRRNRMNFGKLRPQIFLSILCLSILAVVGVWQGYAEISTATIGGIIALGMKVLENE